MAAGGGMVYWKNWIRLRDAKKHTIKAFWWFKGDLISQWIPKFYLCDESNPINPQCGKISAIHPLPTQPTHNFTHTNGGNLDTLPGWPKKLHLNRPARCAGQWRGAVIFSFMCAEQSDEQTVDMLVISNAIALIMTSLYWYCTEQLHAFVNCVCYYFKTVLE